MQRSQPSSSCRDVNGSTDASRRPSLDSALLSTRADAYPRRRQLTASALSPAAEPSCASVAEELQLEVRELRRRQARDLKHLDENQDEIMRMLHQVYLEVLR